MDLTFKEVIRLKYRQRQPVRGKGELSSLFGETLPEDESENEALPEAFIEESTNSQKRITNRTDKEPNRKRRKDVQPDEK